jgi:hypothetical protein
MNYNPAQLSSIDAVEIVDLKSVDPDRASDYMKEAVAAPQIRVTDELAQQIASLWRKLPLGEPARCHIPPYGLRFYNGGDLLLQASICWQCNNIFGDEKGNSFGYLFDAEHSYSRELLATCKQIFESP